MTDKSDILDRIDVRFMVAASIDIPHEGENYHAKTSFSVTCGVYSCVPDKKNLADLINSRGIYESDIDDLTGTGTALTKEKAAEIIAENGITPKHIDSAHIAEVTVDEDTVAEAL
tara:strand:- start:2608 stop:2952 length:345 start_codon:yes stop_codon:yes gene_type:complete